MRLDLEVIENKFECKDAITVRFAKPDGFNYIAGQYLTYQLPVQDPKGSTRQFTLASSPTEDFLQLTTKLSDSAFKQALEKMGRGAKIKAVGPQGEFVLEDAPHHVMIAGGIGITPFRSMIKFAVDTELDVNIKLLYSNRVPEEIAFRDELDKWQFLNQKLRVVHTVTRPEESKYPWSGRPGRVDAELIKENMADGCVFYVCGPQGMVAAMTDLLKEMGISEDRIKKEEFTGY
jgi:ferredoxin-NADP reductase